MAKEMRWANCSGGPPAMLRYCCKPASCAPGVPFAILFSNFSHNVIPAFCDHFDQNQMSSSNRYTLIAKSQLSGEETSNNQYGATSDTMNSCTAKLLVSGRCGGPSLVMNKKKAFWVYRDLQTLRTFKASVNSQSGLVDIFIHRDLVDEWTDHNRALSERPEYLDFLEWFRSLVKSKLYAR